MTLYDDYTVSIHLYVVMIIHLRNIMKRPYTSESAECCVLQETTTVPHSRTDQHATSPTVDGCEILHQFEFLLGTMKKTLSIMELHYNILQIRILPINWCRISDPILDWFNLQIFLTASLDWYQSAILGASRLRLTTVKQSALRNPPKVDRIDLLMDLPSGEHTVCELENGPVEIVDLPIKHGDVP